MYIHMRIERTPTFNNTSKNRRQQNPQPVILTPDDDHIDRNM
jgi:hypothetical protein